MSIRYYIVLVTLCFLINHKSFAEPSMINGEIICEKTQKVNVTSDSKKDYQYRFSSGRSNDSTVNKIQRFSLVTESTHDQNKTASIVIDDKSVNHVLTVNNGRLEQLNENPFIDDSVIALNQMNDEPLIIQYSKNPTDNYLIYITQSGLLSFLHDKGNEIAYVWGFIADSIINNQFDENLFKKSVISSYLIDKNHDGVINAQDGDKAYIFYVINTPSPNLYAFDVTQPETPLFLWSISSDKKEFRDLNNISSSPKAVALSSSQPLLVFSAEEINLETKQHSSLYFLDVATGELRFKVASDAQVHHTEQTILLPELTTSALSEIVTMDGDSDGFIDRLYVADKEGAIWRMDLPNENPLDWSVFKFADFTKDKINDSNDVSFSFQVAPIIARSMADPFSPPYQHTHLKNYRAFDAVLMPSSGSSQSHGYVMVRDWHTQSYVASDDKPAPVHISDLVNVNVVQTDSTQDETEIPAGWYYLFDASDENVSDSGYVIEGTSYFSSFVPHVSQPEQCHFPLLNGYTRLYALDFQTGKPIHPQPFVEFSDWHVEHLNFTYWDHQVQLLGLPGLKPSAKKKIVWQPCEGAECTGLIPTGYQNEPYVAGFTLLENE